MKVLFLYYDPHYAHAEMAKALHADFYPAPKLRSDSSNMIIGGLQIIKSVITLPKNYDVYFCEGTYIIPALARKLGILNRKAKIVNILASPFLYYTKIGRIKGIRKKFALWLLKEVDLFVSVGKMEDKILKEILPNAKSIVVYPKPKKEVVTALTKDTRIPNLNSYKLLIIGTNSAYYKGVDIVYEAFKIVKKEFPKAELFIVGKMPDLSKYVDCNVEGVHCLGYVENLVEVIKKAALYVHMGRGDTFPLSCVEAMLGGLPTIVSEWTGTKEVVEKVNKNLIVELDPYKLAKKIKWYFSLNYKEKLKLSKKSKMIASEFLKGSNVRYFIKKFKQNGLAKSENFVNSN
jgi:glycosyltransferase involved in cell wall biosynthesis